MRGRVESIRNKRDYNEKWIRETMLENTYSAIVTDPMQSLMILHACHLSNL